MATSYTTLYFSNGQTLSVINATTAVGASPSVNLNGRATAANGTDFVLRSNCILIDQINDSACTAGQMEIYNVDRSIRTGRLIDNALAPFADSVVKRVVQRIGFTAGTTYRFVQTVLQA
jgi:hypothetical protein